MRRQWWGACLGAHLQVRQPIVLAAALLALVGDVSQPLQSPVQLRRLLRQLGAMRLMLFRGELRILFHLVLQVAQRLREVRLGVLHETNDLALLERRRHDTTPFDSLGQVDRHALAGHAELMQSIGDGELLRASLVGDLGHELATRKRGKVDVDVDRQLCVRTSARVHIQSIDRLEVTPLSVLRHNQARRKQRTRNRDRGAAKRTHLQVVVRFIRRVHVKLSQALQAHRSHAVVGSDRNRRPAAYARAGGVPIPPRRESVLARRPASCCGVGRGLMRGTAVGAPTPLLPVVGGRVGSLRAKEQQ